MTARDLLELIGIVAGVAAALAAVFYPIFGQLSAVLSKLDITGQKLADSISANRREHESFSAHLEAQDELLRDHDRSIADIKARILK